MIAPFHYSIPRAAQDLPEAGLGVQQAVAVYMMLDAYGYSRFAAHAVQTSLGVALDSMDYSNIPGREFRPKGDADGDRWPNGEEWIAALTAAGGNAALAAQSFAESALTPDSGAAADGSCSATPPGSCRATHAARHPAHNNNPLAHGILLLAIVKQSPALFRLPGQYLTTAPR